MHCSGGNGSKMKKNHQQLFGAVVFTVSSIILMTYLSASSVFNEYHGISHEPLVSWDVKTQVTSGNTTSHEVITAEKSNQDKPKFVKPTSYDRLKIKNGKYFLLNYR
jgi:hypothetical protein